jgi:hypothetical protein
LTRANIDEAMIAPVLSGYAAAQFGVKLARHLDAQQYARRRPMVPTLWHSEMPVGAKPL